MLTGASPEPDARSRDTATPGDLVKRHLNRVVIAADRLILTFKLCGPDAEHNTEPETVTIPWSAPRNGALAYIEGNDQTACSPKPNPAVVQAIVRAHAWLRLLTGTYDSIEALAQVVGIPESERLIVARK